MNTSELSASEHALEAVLDATWQAPRDDWTVWVDLPTRGQHNGLCVAAFYSGLRPAGRRRFSPVLTRLMNGVVTVGETELIPAGEWTAAGARSIRLRGNVAITTSSLLDRAVATALRDRILQRLISAR